MPPADDDEELWQRLRRLEEVDKSAMSTGTLEVEDKCELGTSGARDKAAACGGSRPRVFSCSRGLWGSGRC